MDMTDQDTFFQFSKYICEREVPYESSLDELKDHF